MLLSEIAAHLGLTLPGQDLEITGVNTLEKASSTELSFLANPKYASLLATTKAAAIIVAADARQTNKNYLVSANPYLDFVRSVELFAKPQGQFVGISELAVIHPTAQVDPQAAIAPFVVIGERASIKARARLFSGVYVGEDCVIGEDSTIYPNCTLMAGTLVGKRVILHAGAVLGSDGFGFAQGPGGSVKFPQIGCVVIEDDVEIGANTTIDRAALEETRIGQGTKIDNLVQVAHNVHIGKHCFLAAQTGIAGSASLGDYISMGGQSAVAGHIHIGDRCRIGGKSGAVQNIPPGQDVSGIPAMPHKTFLRTATILPSLPELKRRIGRLEKELDALKVELTNKESLS